MVRNIVGGLTGVVCAVAIVFLVEAITHTIYPPPEGVDISDPEQLEALVRSMPKGALILIIVGHAIGALIGGVTAAAVALRHRLVTALVVGALVMVAGIVNLVAIRHPVWFVVSDVAVYLPCALVGGWLGAAMSGRPRSVTFA